MIVKIPVLLLSELCEDSQDIVRELGYGYDVRVDAGCSLLLEADVLKSIWQGIDKDCEESNDLQVILDAVKEAESINSKFIIAIAEDDMAGFVQNSLRS